MHRSAPSALLLVLLVLSPGGADTAVGWRGNGTGLFPDANPPLEWYRVPKGVLTDLRSRANRPGDKAEADAVSLEKGIVREWLVLGPFPVKDSVEDIDKAQLPDETGTRPAAGDKVGALTWKTLSAPTDDPFAFGPATPPTTDLAAAVGGFQRNQVVYAHTYLYSPRGGTARAVVDHAHGMKAWLNGKEVYRSPERAGGLGNYYAFSRVEFGTYDLTPSPRFDLDLKPGWNRLLLKVTSYNKPGWTDQSFLMRLMDLPTVPYESKNILWMTELPHRSNATPIVVGPRIFVMAEPDELLCIDKETGKILWTAANNYYEALTPEERRANPAFKEKIDPLIAELKQEKDFIKRTKLHTQIQRTLVKIDAARFAWKADGHFQEHFGIVGFTTPTPVSDGKHVWVWCGNGVAACYDLDGNRRWITRVPTTELTYACSPALADGTLAVFMHRLVGLDARTGKVRWEQEEISSNNGSVLAAEVAGMPVFVSHRGHVVRARDGQVLHLEPDPRADHSWTAGVIRGDVVYVPEYGVHNLHVLDFAGARGDKWEPKRQTVRTKGVGRLPNGHTADRSTAGSPLVADDHAYLVDIYGTFYAFDLKAKEMLYYRDTGLRGLFHYNALPVAASPVLIGKHVVVQNNQGTALVLQRGREYREVRKNHIATQLDRYWPIPAQETIGYAPLVAVGKRMYLRGERYLYCIGEK
jgi:outer membrane protein assembly factor BamB